MALEFDYSWQDVATFRGGGSVCMRYQGVLTCTVWTDQELEETRASPEFIEFQKLNGGEPAPTARNRAVRALDSSLDPTVMAHRAEFRTQFDELNQQIERITDVLVAAAGATGFNSFQAAIAAIQTTLPVPPIEQQTRARDFIASGGADTPLV